MNKMYHSMFLHIFCISMHILSIYKHPTYMHPHIADVSASQAPGHGGTVTVTLTAAALQDFAPGWLPLCSQPETPNQVTLTRDPEPGQVDPKPRRREMLAAAMYEA